MKNLALPPSKTIPTTPIVRRRGRGRCYLNTPKCSISTVRRDRTELHILACEDDAPDAYMSPTWDVTITHIPANDFGDGGEPYNLFDVRLDRCASLDELRAAAEALLEACRYLPETGIPSLTR